MKSYKPLVTKNSRRNILDFEDPEIAALKAKYLNKENTSKRKESAKNSKKKLITTSNNTKNLRKASAPIKKSNTTKKGNSNERNYITHEFELFMLERDFHERKVQLLLKYYLKKWRFKSKTKKILNRGRKKVIPDRVAELNKLRLENNLIHRSNNNDPEAKALKAFEQKKNYINNKVNDRMMARNEQQAEKKNKVVLKNKYQLNARKDSATKKKDNEPRLDHAKLISAAHKFKQFREQKGFAESNPPVGTKSNKFKNLPTFLQSSSPKVLPSKLGDKKRSSPQKAVKKKNYDVSMDSSDDEIIKFTNELLRKKKKENLGDTMAENDDSFSDFEQPRKVIQVPPKKFDLGSDSDIDLDVIRKPPVLKTSAAIMEPIESDDEDDIATIKARIAANKKVANAKLNLSINESDIDDPKPKNATISMINISDDDEDDIIPARKVGVAPQPINQSSILFNSSPKKFQKKVSSPTKYDESDDEDIANILKSVREIKEKSKNAFAPKHQSLEPENDSSDKLLKDIPSINMSPLKSISPSKAMTPKKDSPKGKSVTITASPKKTSFILDDDDDDLYSAKIPAKQTVNQSPAKEGNLNNSRGLLFGLSDDDDDDIDTVKGKSSKNNSAILNVSDQDSSITSFIANAKRKSVQSPVTVINNDSDDENIEEFIKKERQKTSLALNSPITKSPVKKPLSLPMPSLSETMSEEKDQVSKSKESSKREQTPKKKTINIDIPDLSDSDEELLFGKNSGTANVKSPEKLRSGITGLPTVSLYNSDDNDKEPESIYNVNINVSGSDKITNIDNITKINDFGQNEMKINNDSVNIVETSPNRSKSKINYDINVDTSDSEDDTIAVSRVVIDESKNETVHSPIKQALSPVRVEESILNLKSSLKKPSQDSLPTINNSPIGLQLANQSENNNTSKDSLSNGISDVNHSFGAGINSPSRKNTYLNDTSISINANNMFSPYNTTSLKEEGKNGLNVITPVRSPPRSFITTPTNKFNDGSFEELHDNSVSKPKLNIGLSSDDEMTGLQEAKINDQSPPTLTSAPVNPGLDQDSESDESIDNFIDRTKSGIAYATQSSSDIDVSVTSKSIEHARKILEEEDDIDSFIKMHAPQKIIDKVTSSENSSMVDTDYLIGGVNVANDDQDELDRVAIETKNKLDEINKLIGTESDDEPKGMTPLTKKSRKANEEEDYSDFAIESPPKSPPLPTGINNITLNIAKAKLEDEPSVGKVEGLGHGNDDTDDEIDLDNKTKTQVEFKAQVNESTILNDSAKIDDTDAFIAKIKGSTLSVMNNVTVNDESSEEELLKSIDETINSARMRNSPVKPSNINKEDHLAAPIQIPNLDDDDDETDYIVNATTLQNTSVEALVKETRDRISRIEIPSDDDDDDEDADEFIERLKRQSPNLGLDEDTYKTNTNETIDIDAKYHELMNISDESEA